MKLLRSPLLAVLLIFVGLTSSIAQLPKGYTLGDVIGDFRLKNVDDKTISLSDYRAQKGLIVVFMSNHCPFSKAYEDRLIALDQKFNPQGYPLLSIMPNDPASYENDSFDNMKIRSREKNYPFPYVIDETQVTTRAFGATRTPQVFVLKQKNNEFILEYTGTIDDSPQDETMVQRRYVDEAVSSLVAGRPVQSPITKPIGCAIKWKN